MGAFAHANHGGERRSGGRHRQAVGGTGRSTTPGSWPPTTSSTCPATVSPRAAGTARRQLARAVGRSIAGGFQAMFEGRDPTGGVVSRPHGRNAVPAFDVVPRPTKSVSVLHVRSVTQRPDERWYWPHAGLAEAVASFDGHLGGPPRQCRWATRGRTGLVGVGFDHRTSREGDPLLHTHLVANRVQGPDGRWTALAAEQPWAAEGIAVPAEADPRVAAASLTRPSSSARRRTRACCDACRRVRTS